MAKNKKKPNKDIESFPTTQKKVIISPITKNQEDYLDKIETSDITFGIGPAGSGKTFLAAKMAMSAMVNNHINKIIICRPAIEAGGEKLGYLPGTINEKMDPYLRPIFDVFGSYWGPQTIRDYTKDGRIEVAALGFLRGRTFHNAFVLLDEAQNCSTDNLLMLITRLGEGSKIVITGDPRQKDIKNSCLSVAKKYLEKVDTISFVEFDHTDVVRHPTVKKILEAWPDDTNY